MTRYSTSYEASAFPHALQGNIVTADGLRRSISRPSEIITQGQIPTGAEVVRINNPPEYITHERVAQPAPQVQYYEEPGCCENISSCCYPSNVYNNAANAGRGLQAGASNLAQGAANTAARGYHGVRQACPWWLWLIIGIIGFFLLAGIIWGLLLAFAPAFSRAWQGTKNVASGAWEGTKNIASGAWEGSKNIGRHVGEGAKTAAHGIHRGLKTAADATGNVASGAWEGAKNIGSHVGEGAKNAAEGIGSGIKSAADATGNIAGAAWDGTKKVGSGIVEGGKTFGEGVGKALSHEELEELNAHRHFRRAHYRKYY